MEKEVYYSMLYEASYPDTGIISYKPIKLIKGFYDKEKNSFTEELSNNVYNCVNLNIPSFGKEENHILDALEEEIQLDEYEQKLFFAFPVEEELLKYYYDSDTFKGHTKEELYEREIRRFYLFSAYDAKLGDNIPFVVDKLDGQRMYDIDVCKEVVSSVIESYNSDPLNKLFETVATSLLINPDEVSNLEIFDDEDEEELEKPESAFTEILYDFDPDELEEKINSEVIGQEHVVKALVSAIYKNRRYHHINGLKSNVMILGQSGCGKTEIVRSLARHLNIPLTIFDATTTSATGFVGNSTSQAIRDLISICNGDIEKAENGIIVIDEIDKLAEGDQYGITKGDVQDELFKMLEGDEITIPSDNVREKTTRINTKNITFIGIGSAQALIDKKSQKKRVIKIGFNDKEVKEEILNEKKEGISVNPKDLINFGLKPELLRRFPVIEVVNPLKTQDLVTILTNSKISNLKLYEKALSEIDNTKLIYDHSLLTSIAELATKESAGASGLKRVVDDMLQIAIRKTRLLNGEPGELVLSKDTLEDPNNFQLYKVDEDKKEVVYSPKVKIKNKE